MKKGRPSQDQMFFFWKVFEGALKGDAEKVRNYAEHFLERLESDDDTANAKRLRQLLTGQTVRTASLQRMSAPSLAGARLPVDSESRLPMADEERWDRGSVPLIVPPDTRARLDRFLKHFRASDRLLASGVPISPSILLHGPPGTGKTQAARFIASELQLPLIVSRSDALISSYLGSTAKNVRLLFDHAASRPCVLFLEEFDALAKRRDDAAELGELKRVVIGLLQNIDALSRDHVLIAATNHEHLLDSAIWRRFAYHIHLGLPGESERRAMLDWFFQDYVDAAMRDAIAVLADGLSGAQLRELCEDAVRESVLEGGPVNLPHLLDRLLTERGLLVKNLSAAKKAQLADELGSRRISQQAIGRLLGLSQPYVSRSLRKAK